jgi:hypothetical protein
MKIHLLLTLLLTISGCSRSGYYKQSNDAGLDGSEIDGSLFDENELDGSELEVGELDDSELDGGELDGDEFGGDEFNTDGFSIDTPAEFLAGGIPVTVVFQIGEVEANQIVWLEYGLLPSDAGPGDENDLSNYSWTFISDLSLDATSTSWNVPEIDAQKVHLRLVVGPADHSESLQAAVSGLFLIDSTPPTISAFELAGGSASYSRSHVPITSLVAHDNDAVADYYFSNNPQLPATDTIPWQSVSLPPLNQPIGPDLSVTGQHNLFFALDLVDGNYSVYAFVRDRVGHVSVLSAGGAGTQGVDRYDILLALGTPAKILNLRAANTDTPTVPAITNETNFIQGDPLYLGWKIEDRDPVPAGNIRVLFRLPGEDWQDLAGGQSLSDQANGACVLQPHETGCALLTAPSSDVFTLRVGVENAEGLVTFVTSNILNSSNLLVRAGNLDAGLDGSARGALFFGNSQTQPGIFVVTSSGEIFFLDLTRGVLRYDPADGIVSLYIPTTGTQVGDNEPVTSATLENPERLALDFEDRLLIRDNDRIRRVDNDGIIRTIIGGGQSTTDGVGPTELYLHPAGNTWEFGSVLVALPNGDIYLTSRTHFTSVDPSENFLWKYNHLEDRMEKISFGGIGYEMDPNANVEDLWVWPIVITFDPATSTVTNIIAAARAEPTYDAPYGGLLLDGSGISVGPHHAVPSGPTIGTRLEGLDGQAYTFGPHSSTDRYDQSTNSWSEVYPHNGYGTCEDEVLIDDCRYDADSLFVDRLGRIYFLDRGRIRTVAADGSVRTIIGQAAGYGDGGAPLDARFGSMAGLALWGGVNPEVTVVDEGAYRIRNIAIDGTVEARAGNGQQTTARPGDSPLDKGVCLGACGADHIETDPSNGELFFAQGDYVLRVPQDGLVWEVALGTTDGGAPFIWEPEAEGATSVQFGNSSPEVVGYRASTNEIVVHNTHSINYEHYNGILAAFDVTSGQQTTIMGYEGPTDYNQTCADGTATNACNVPYLPLSTVWDEPRSQWLIFSANVRIQNISAGMVYDYVTLENRALWYILIESSNLIVYCAEDGLLYLHDVAGSSESTLPWPDPDYFCSGLNGRYSTFRNSIFFSIGLQGGSYGVAEYYLP